MGIIPVRGTPVIGRDVVAHESVVITGETTVGDEVFFLPGVVLRGDIRPIVIGNESNLQEHVIIHTSRGRSPAVVGNRVTIGHRAMLHSCRIEDNVIVGMGAIILDEALIGPYCLIGAGSLVTEHTVIPEGSLAFGSPARVIRPLTAEERAGIDKSAESYSKLRGEYRTAPEFTVIPRTLAAKAQE